MKSTIIACSMMEDEVNVVRKELGCEIPVIWMDRGLHNTPEKLKTMLQEQIDQLQDQDLILLTFGLCGNGTAGLVSPNAKMVIPRFDDCINQYLCVGKRTARALAQPGILYVTGGWIQDDGAVLQQYEQWKDQYDDDEEMLEDLIDMMYGSYSGMDAIDTGCFEMQPVEAYIAQAAELLKLKPGKVPGSLQILRQLLTGDWDENFIVLEPGETLVADMFDFKR